LQKLIINLESNIDRLPIQMQLVQCPKCAAYSFIELLWEPETQLCHNCQHPGLTVVDNTPDTEHRFVGWGWKRVEAD